MAIISDSTCAAAWLGAGTGSVLLAGGNAAGQTARYGRGTERASSRVAIKSTWAALEDMGTPSTAIAMPLGGEAV